MPPISPQPEGSPQPNVGLGSLALLPLRFWALVPLTGIGAGLAAGLLMALLRAVQHLAWPARGADFLTAVQQAGPAHRVVILAGAGVIVALARWAMSLRKGGHGGEVAEAIWFRAGHLPVLRTLANAVTSIVIVGMGASLGREAAPKQTGAVWAGVLSHLAGLPPAQRRLLAACGAGAGIAAVYNVPFGGALFAVEVLLGSLSLPLVPPALCATLLGTATAWLFLPMQPTYQVPFYPAPPSLLAWAVPAGPLAGLAAVLYIRLIAWADARKPRGWAVLAAPVGVFAGLGALAITLPQILGNGRGVVQLAFTGQLAVPLLALLVVLRPLATAACLGSGAPGGLFTPTITFGAVLGGLAGAAWAWLWPGVPIGACAVIGAGAMLAASTQGPISAIVLLLELTRRLDTLMVPLMLAVAGAVLTARLIEARSIYSCRIHLGRAEAAGRSDDDAIPAISSAARYTELLHALLTAPRLRVVDEAGATIGAVAAAEVVEPPAGAGPLEVATARDFAA